MMKRYNHDELGMKASEEKEYLIECKSIHGDDDIGGPPQELSKMHTTGTVSYSTYIINR